MALGTFGLLGSLALIGEWPFAPNGRVDITDFATVWAAGVRALAGDAKLVYELHLHEEFYASLIRQPAANGLTFGYPPTALLLFSLVGALPYSLGLLVYLLLGAGLWVMTLRRLTGDIATALPMAFAWGGATHTILLGQNGFLTAAALAGGLLALTKKPTLAGILFGLLAIKPHLGLALIIFLLVRRDWAAIAAATGTVTVMVIATLVLWGTEVWSQYLMASREIAELISQRTDTIIAGKMQSVFAVAVDHVSVQTAMGIHVIVAGIALGMMTAVVVRRAPYPLQMASLIAASLLVTPYSFLYDCTVLTAAAACLLQTSVSRGEQWVVRGVMVLPGMWFFTAEPFVPLVCVTILVLCLRLSRMDPANEGAGHLRPHESGASSRRADPERLYAEAHRFAPNSARA